jgi:hypothetical protein
MHFAALRSTNTQRAFARALENKVFAVHHFTRYDAPHEHHKTTYHDHP